jgi:hypothetical protein
MFPIVSLLLRRLRKEEKKKRMIEVIMKHIMSVSEQDSEMHWKLLNNIGKGEKNEEDYRRG